MALGMMWGRRKAKGRSERIENVAEEAEVEGAAALRMLNLAEK
jgi:hypothetical protein